MAHKDARSMFDLTGKLALVTGCRRGIGLAMAEALAAAGADIIGASQQLEPGGSDVQQRVEAAGRSFTGYRVDFADRDAVKQLATDVAAGDRPVDILVNNAGTIIRSAAVDHDDDAWDTVVEVDLTAPFVLTREFGKGMVERRSGKVIFTASLLSFQGGIRVPSYTAAKSGIAGLVRAFSNEWARLGVNVNGIAPATSRRTTRMRSATTPTAMGRCSSGSRPDGGGGRTTSPESRSSSHRSPPTTCAGRSSRSTVAGWHDELSARPAAAVPAWPFAGLHLNSGGGTTTASEATQDVRADVFDPRVRVGVPACLRQPFVRRNPNALVTSSPSCRIHRGSPRTRVGAIHERGRRGSRNGYASSLLSDEWADDRPLQSRRSSGRISGRVAETADQLADSLRRLSVDLPRVLAEITVPVFVVNRHGVIRRGISRRRPRWCRTIVRCA